MAIDAARLEAIAALQAKAGVWTVPTLVQPLRELITPAELATQLASSDVNRIPAAGRQQWEAITRRLTGRMDADDWTLVAAARVNRRAVVGALHKAGVPLLAGTDTPNPFVVPGFSLHDEIALLVEAGLTPFAALAASTREAARFLGGDWGLLEAGRPADLVVLDANPLDDIRHTRRIHTVVLQGAVIDRTTRR
jgi:imidazolonepropionase-like amidohydrolase